MLSKEGSTLSRWSLVTLVGVLQTFIGLFMVVIALFYLISSQDRTWRMGVVVGGGSLELAVGLGALWLMRREHKWLGLLVIVVSAGLELLFVVAMSAFKFSVPDLVRGCARLFHRTTPPHRPTSTPPPHHTCMPSVPSIQAFVARRTLLF
jgi:hypothetical protein